MFREMKLGDLCSLRAGSAFKTHFQGNKAGQYPFIKVSDMNLPSNEVWIREANNWIEESVRAEIKAKPLPPGTTVFAKIGEALRQNRVRLLVMDTIVDNNMMGAIPKSDLVDPSFFYYLLSDFDIAGTATGTALPYLTVSTLVEASFSIPPLPVQRRIAAILSAYDELIENSQRRIKVLEAMARALYREWFVHFRFPGHEHCPRVPSALGDIPQGWQVRKLGEISSYISRGITPRYDAEGNSLVINQKCIRDQRLGLEPARRQSKAIPREKLVCFGDVLINSTGVGTLGRVAQVYENLKNCTVDTHVTIARAAHGTNLDFYGCCLLSLQESLERLGTGATGQTELGRAAISDIELVVPPADLQRSFGEVATGMRMAALTLGRQILGLRRTRDLLLPRLLSGQIDVEALAA